METGIETYSITVSRKSRLHVRVNIVKECLTTFYTFVCHPVHAQVTNGGRLVNRNNGNAGELSGKCVPGRYCGDRGITSRKFLRL